MDVTMPVMDGWTLLKRMQEQAALRDLPVVVLSAVMDLDRVVGARSVMRKPVEPERLTRTLRALVPGV